MLKLQILFLKKREITVSDENLSMFFENNLIQEISLAYDVITRNTDLALDCLLVQSQYWLPERFLPSLLTSPENSVCQAGAAAPEAARWRPK